MGFRTVPLNSIPSGMVLDQALMETSLKTADLIDKYGFMFQSVKDDISSAMVSVIESDSGNYYLVIAREELPEQQTSIVTSRSTTPLEEYVQSRISDFIGATEFDVSTIQQIWDFANIEGSKPA
jgi:hypothetical protein